jgi:hypothetical protein
MMAFGPFRDIGCAPKDGTAIEVRYGPRRCVAIVHWSADALAFVRDADPIRRPLQLITGWRPVADGRG